MRRFRRWFRTERHVRAEIDEEIRSHLDARVDHLVAQGMPEQAARREALRRFGDVEAARTALLAQARVRRRRVDLALRIEQAAQDVRYVTRSLLRAPVFSLGVIATFALGLGINAAVFRVADPVLFRPPALVENPSEIRRVHALVTLGTGTPQRATAFSYSDARALVEGAAFRAATIYSPPKLQLGPGDREIAVSAVDAAYFPVLGVQPIEGRAFDPREAEPGAAHRVALVSFDYWSRWMAAAPLQEGPTIIIDGRRFAIIGVAPQGFSGIDLDPVDVWLPLGDATFGRSTINGVEIPWYRNGLLRALRVVGRPIAGIPREQAAERLTTIFSSLDGGLGGLQRKAVLRPLGPAGDPTRNADATHLLSRLAAVAGVVLLIACANAASLMLARVVRRERELGIRAALGAAPARITRLLLVESLMLGIAGGVAAIAAAGWSGRALLQLVLPDARWTATANDPRTIVFTGALALTAGVAAGLLAARRASRPDLSRAISVGRTSRGDVPRRMRAALIVMQTALSIALLITSGLLVQSLVRLNDVPLGFVPDDLVTVSLSSSRLEGSDESIVGIASRLRSAPGVLGIARASIAPFGAKTIADITVPGSPFQPEANDDLPYMSAVSHDFFATLQTRVLIGRGFVPLDVRGAEPVAVVNESMGRRYWQGASPFGSCILAPGHPCARVVGVVEDVRDAPGGGPPPMRFYLPLEQTGDPGVALVVRARPGEGEAVANLVRSLVPPAGRAVIEVTSERIRRAVRPWRNATLLFLLLGAVALTLSCVGLYSVMSYLVTQRLHEFGVRLALGASPADVLGLVVRDGLRLIAAGGLVGMVMAAATGRFLGSLLFDVSPVEPAIYAGSFLVLIAAAMAASIPPAVRAVRLDPLRVLRSD